MLEHQPWMKSLWDIGIEAQQANEEGRDLAEVTEELSALMADARNPALYARTDALYERIQHLPLRQDYNFVEPDDFESIQQQRPQAPKLPALSLEGQGLYDRVLGAWQGRLAGCLLGQPVEGWRKERILGFLKDTNNLPIKRYLASNVGDALREQYGIIDGPGGYGAKHISWINLLDGLQEDDDINYTVLALKAVSLYGRGFTPGQLALEWLQSLPLLRTCTAERVAYLNLSRLMEPPASAKHANPYREWIGAQIRTDFYGYINPGRPDKAAEMAWRDASISHVKNGIYGAMLAAAMVAAAFASGDPEVIVQAGMAQIPEGSRLYAALSALLDDWRKGASLSQFQDKFYDAWDESNPHHWCHTIPNALLVAAGLLYHGMDYTASIAFGVTSGFDTDCNAATIGSIIGANRGAHQLPPEWAKPLGGRVRTCVPGYDRMEIDTLARMTLDLVE